MAIVLQPMDHLRLLAGLRAWAWSMALERASLLGFELQIFINLSLKSAGSEVKV